MPDRRSRLSSGRPRNRFGAGDDDAVRIAEKQIGAHAAQLLEREQPQLVQPVVHQRLPSACVASTVTRLTRSLGNPGHRPVVIRPAAFGVDRVDPKRSPSIAHAMCHPLEHRGDHFHVFRARAVDIDLAAGDGGNDRPAAGLDVVAPQPMFGAVKLRAAFDPDR